MPSGQPYHRLRTLLFTACASVALSFPSPALADPCASGHYEYDHGECYDKSGSTTSTMIEMYDSGDHLQQTMIDRGRGLGMGNVVGAGGSAPRLPESERQRMMALGFASIRALTSTPTGDAATIAALTRRLPARDRARGRVVMRRLLSDYRVFVTSLGFPANVFSTASLVSAVFAYNAYDGDRWSAPEIARQTWIGSTIAIATQPAMQAKSKAELERFNDTLALIGATLFLGAVEARAEHDTVALARIRDQARRFLINFHRIDPSKTRLDDLVCVVSPFGATGPCEELKWFMSGGKVGRFSLRR